MAPKAKPRASAQRSRSSSSQVTSITRRAGPKSKSKVPAENAGGGAPENIWKDLQRSPTPELSREEEAAQRLQAACRGWLARLLEARRDREAELAEVMHAAEKQSLRVERQAEELALQHEADRKRQKEELEKNIEAFVLTAFDGDVQEVLPLLEAGVPIDSRSRRDNTALSEAACGGNSEMVRMLLQRRGNPNSRCEFLRTPIWRAAYRGHTAVVQMLLESGGDPRISSECAEMPTDVAAEKETVQLLQRWDLSRTEQLVAAFESWLEQERSQADTFQAKAMQSVEAEVEQARHDNALKQKALAEARAMLRRRIRDHDTRFSEGAPPEVIIFMRGACKEAETCVARAEAEAEKAQRRLDAANVKHLTAAEACGADAPSPAERGLGRALQVRDLNDVLLRDVGDQIAKGQKWFLFIDPSDCTPKFLQYSGNAVLNFWCADEMAPGYIRRALLSMLRAGGVLGLNLTLLGSGTDLELVAEPFEAVLPGLFKALMSRELLDVDPEDARGWPLFYKLVDDEGDYDMFSPSTFCEDRTSKFKFVVMTSSALPHEELLEHFDVLRVVPNTHSSTFS